MSELAKVIAARPKAELLAEFLIWLTEEKDLRVCKEYAFGYAPLTEEGPATLIADFLGLDLEAAQAEQEAQPVVVK